MDIICSSCLNANFFAVIMVPFTVAFNGIFLVGVIRSGLDGDPFSLRGKQQSGRAARIDIRPTRTKPSHQAPIHAGCRGLIGTAKIHIQLSVG